MSNPAGVERKIRLNRKYKPLFDIPDGIRYIIMSGGRGSGKSFGASCGITDKLNRETGRKILYTRFTLASAKDSIIAEMKEKIELMGLENSFEVLEKDIRHVSNGSEILFRGIKVGSNYQTAKLKSIQGINMWVCDEADEIPNESLFDTIDLSIRDRRCKNIVILIMNPCHKSHWIYERFFVKRPKNAMYIHSSYLDNIENLDSEYVRVAEECRVKNPMKYRYIWLGEWIEQVEGAFWSWDMIQNYRWPIEDLPEMKRIVVAVDPAATSGENSDETGIVVVGLGCDSRYYVLADKTLRATPTAWAAEVVRCYNYYKADRVVAEKNMGGDMVEATIRQVDDSIPYQGVHAARGKTVRAEPIAALYARGLVSHCDQFRELEGEMMTYTGDPRQKSPNHLDALVHGISSLLEAPPVAKLELAF